MKMEHAVLPAVEDKIEIHTKHIGFVGWRYHAMFEKKERELTAERTGAQELLTETTRKCEQTQSVLDGLDENVKKLEKKIYSHIFDHRGLGDT